MEEGSTGAVRSKLFPSIGEFPLRLDLMMANDVAMRRIGETYGEGSLKYGDDNWKKGFPRSVMISHCLEHIRLYMAGNTDEDHLAHAAWNLMSQMWFDEKKPELNP
jgi:hypothetical protein